MRRHLDNEVGPDQLAIALDAQGASALQVTRKAQLCKDTALALNRVRLEPPSRERLVPRPRPSALPCVPVLER